MKLRDLFENAPTKAITPITLYGEDGLPDPAPWFVGEKSNMTSLEGGPKVCNDDYNVSNNKLTSLQYGPVTVKGSFKIYLNKLTSLDHGPTEVGGDYNCGGNELTTLRGAPRKIPGDFDCSNNRLTSLEGAPTFILGDFNCSTNNLTSLHNIHKQIKSIGGFGNFCNNPIKSHVLGLLLIKGLASIQFSGLGGDRGPMLSKIINKHLATGRDIIECQNELIDAGLGEYAEL